MEDCYNDQDEDYDSEDSNQENYYTNDYPDDDEAGAVGSDEELCQQMNKFMFGRKSEYIDIYIIYILHIQMYYIARDPSIISLLLQMTMKMSLSAVRVTMMITIRSTIRMCTQLTQRQILL